MNNRAIKDTRLMIYDFNLFWGEIEPKWNT